jgi:anti-anti-sigma factor
MSSVAEIRIDRDEENVTISGSGALDLSNADEFRRGLSSASSVAQHVTVDLRSATFIDTAILEYLARAAKAMLDRGKRLKVMVAENGHPQYVLETVGFPEIMDIEVVPVSQ